MLYISSILFALNSVIVKIAAKNYSGMFISSIRFIIGIILTAAAVIYLKKGFRVNNKKAWILRGISGAVSMICYYIAINITSSGRATLLVNTYPLFVAVLGFLLFKEKISKSIIISLIFCTTGVFFVLYDGSNYNITGDLFALAGGIAAGFAVQYIKQGRERDNSFIIYLSPCIFGLVIFPFTFNEFSNLTVNGSVILFLIGLITFLAQLFMAYGYKEIQASKGSIIFYLETILAILFSLFIDERLSIKFFIGLAFVILGLIINNYEKVLAYERR